MTDKELRRLSRGELLEMLLAKTEENEKLKTDLERAEKQLTDRNIAIHEAGSIAEAALALNGIFQAAEGAAQQYLENIQRLSSQQEAACKEIGEELPRKTLEAKARW